MLRYASQSLVSIDLKGGREQISGDDTGKSAEDFYVQEAGNEVEGNTYLIGSLRGFQKLKTISLDSSMLTEVIPGGSKERTKISVHRLTDVLPSSVERLKLTHASKTGQVEEMLYGLPQNKRRLVPKLKQILIIYSVPINEDMQKACAEAKIELLFAETRATWRDGCK